LPSKSFDFNMILSHALLQFSEVSSYYKANQELHQGINMVLLQKTFQSTQPPVNAVTAHVVKKKIFYLSDLSTAKYSR